MYKKPIKYIYKKEELSNYIENNDVYNSTLLSILQNSTFPKINYTITEYEHRPDLIANDIYGSTTFEGLLMLQTGLGLEEYIRGRVISIIPKSSLLSILDNL
jgi:hypothetical protein